MSKMQRVKGAQFEREIANYLGVKRRLGQARDAGHDLDWRDFALELKRRATIAAYDWLEQAERSSLVAEGGKIPAVIARADGKRAIVILYLTDFHPESP